MNNPDTTTTDTPVPTPSGAPTSLKEQLRREQLTRAGVVTTLQYRLADNEAFDRFCAEYEAKIANAATELERVKNENALLHSGEYGILHLTERNRNLCTERDQLRADNAVLLKERDELRLKWESDEPGRPGRMLRGLANKASELTAFGCRSSSLTVYLEEFITTLQKDRDALACRVEELKGALDTARQWVRNSVSIGDNAGQHPGLIMDKALASTPADSLSRVGELLRKYREEIQFCLDHSHPCGCTPGASMYGCQHLHNRLHALLSQPLPAFAELAKITL